jgi:hypothetical protein
MGLSCFAILSITFTTMLNSEQNDEECDPSLRSWVIPVAIGNDAIAEQ